jgi:hypothetical protein
LLLERGAQRLQRAYTPPPGPDAPIVYGRLLDGKRFIETPLGRFSIDDGKKEGSAAESLEEWRRHGSTGAGENNDGGDNNHGHEPQQLDTLDVLRARTFVAAKPYRYALVNAAMRGHVEVIDALVKGGAHVNMQDENGLTALHTAAWFGQAASIKALVRAKADVDVQEKKSGLTPLHLAAQDGHQDAIKELLAAGASIYVRSHHGLTPVDVAMQNGHEEAARLIFKKATKAEIRKINAEGSSYRSAAQTYDSGNKAETPETRTTTSWTREADEAASDGCPAIQNTSTDDAVVVTSALSADTPLIDVANKADQVSPPTGSSEAETSSKGELEVAI